MSNEESSNPFKRIDHVAERSPDLKTRVVRSAERTRSLMVIAGLFTTDYISTILRVLGGKPTSSITKPPKN